MMSTNRRLGLVLALVVTVVTAATSCTRDQSGLESSWVHVEGTVTRASDGAGVAGMVPSFEVFLDTACVSQLHATWEAYPAPVTDSVGRYETSLRVHATRVLRTCLAVSVGDETVTIITDFATSQANAPTVEVDLFIP